MEVGGQHHAPAAIPHTSIAHDMTVTVYNNSSFPIRKPIILQRIPHLVTMQTELTQVEIETK